VAAKNILATLDMQRQPSMAFWAEKSLPFPPFMQLFQEETIHAMLVLLL
jgi:hypothetical protein